MELKVLFVEDDKRLGENLIKTFNGTSIAGHTLHSTLITSFQDAISEISQLDYDIVVLDLFQDQEVKSEDAGLLVLNAIRQNAFMPVIFYTGHAYKIAHLRSEIVGVINKSDGIDELFKEFDRIISSKLGLIKKAIYNHLRESLKSYFWETVDSQKNIFKAGSETSLGYLLLRRFANSLTKERIKEILGDEKIKVDKVHPMEFYIYPVAGMNQAYQTGEILEKDGTYFAILTPDCDLVIRHDGSRKADKILLTTAKNFKGLPDYIKYTDLKSKRELTEKESKNLSNLEGKVKNWMKNRGGDQDRFFFLPGTPFLPSLILDFQFKIMLTDAEIQTFNRVARLDLPFAQSMAATFTRYYNRIGFPDIDDEYMLKNI